jgi:hypothetical protein
MSGWKIVAHAVVPASPGWFMLTLNRKGELEEHEIVAWSIQVGEDEGQRGEYWAKQSTHSMPVVIGLTQTDDPVIRRPNRTMFSPRSHEEFGSNEECAIECLKESAEAEKVAADVQKILSGTRYAGA